MGGISEILIVSIEKAFLKCLNPLGQMIQEVSRTQKEMSLKLIEISETIKIEKENAEILKSIDKNLIEINQSLKDFNKNISDLISVVCIKK